MGGQLILTAFAWRLVRLKKNPRRCIHVTLAYPDVENLDKGANKADQGSPLSIKYRVIVRLKGFDDHINCRQG